MKMVLYHRDHRADQTLTRPRRYGRAIVVLDSGSLEASGAPASGPSCVRPPPRLNSTATGAACRQAGRGPVETAPAACTDGRTRRASEGRGPASGRYRRYTSPQAPASWIGLRRAVEVQGASGEGQGLEVRAVISQEVGREATGEGGGYPPQVGIGAEEVAADG